MDKKLLFGIAVLILLFIGGIFFLNARKSKTATVPVQTQQVVPQASQQVSPTAPPIVVPTGKTTVTLTANGFDPQTITVKTKTQVIWTNNSSTDATVNSADHPTHQKYPPLNLGLFPSGSNVSLVFDKPGTYSYHDHLHPEKTGTVVVIE